MTYLTASEHRDFIGRRNKLAYAGYLTTNSGTLAWVVPDRAKPVSIILDGGPWDWIAEESAGLPDEAWAAEREAVMAVFASQYPRSSVQVYASLPAYLKDETLEA